MKRRKFLQGITGTSIAALLPKASVAMTAWGGFADAVPAPLVLDARGQIHPAVASPLHLGGSRKRRDGSRETLSLSNLFLQRGFGTGAGDAAQKPFLPVAGEFHYARYLPELWEDELRKVKAGGVTILSTYLFWIFHEPQEGVFDWKGRRDLRRFVELCEAVGLEVIVRVGPFVHGEMRNGGLPDWLHGKPFPVRSNHPGYLECVGRWYREIGRQLDGLLFEQGGPIVGIQLENEFMSATAPWEATSYHDQPLEWITSGSGGAEHMLRLKKMARESGLNAPLYTCTAWGSPVPELEFLPMYGGYGFEPWSIDAQTQTQIPSWTFLFRAKQSKLLLNGGQNGGAGQGQLPFACCELGGGMQSFYRDRFVVPAESVQATAVTSLGSGCAFLGYYVFHGGSNPAGERVFYGEYDVPHISYDFQAPIRESGQIADSYRAIRPIHLLLESYGERLAAMQTVLPAGAEDLLPPERQAVRCAVRTDGSAGFLFLNNYQDHVPQPERRNLQFEIRLDGGTRTVPSVGGLAIASGESAILPFGLQFGTVRLNWATAQLVTEVVVEGARHVLFLPPAGMEPAFAIQAAGLQHCDAVQGTVERRGEEWVARGSADAGFQLECRTGREKVVFHLLPRSLALQLSAHPLWGGRRLVLSKADVAEIEGDLLLWSTKSAEADAWIFPAPEGMTAAADAPLPGAAKVHGKSEAWAGGVQCQRVSEDAWSIVVASGALASVHNLLLRVEYVGDVGQLYHRGELVADNFANGAPWEIGLRQLGLGDGEQTLVLKVIPRMEGSPVLLDETVPGRERFAGKQVATIDAVEVVPVYRMRIGARGEQR